MMTRVSTRAIAAAAFALVAAAGSATAQTQQWRVTFDITEGTLAGQQFFGLVSYEQATLNANFVTGILEAEFDEFEFTVTPPTGVSLGLVEDPFARLFFAADILTGLDYLGDNGVEAVNTFDSPINVNNFFQVFVDPDFTADGSGTFSFERLTETDIVTAAFNFENTVIDDTDISSTPATADAAEDTNFNGEPNVSVDLDDGPGSFNPRQILIRFNDIIGSGPNQIPAGSQIIGAVFRVEIISTGSGFTTHRLLENWDVNTVTWNNFGSVMGNGVVPNGVEAAVESTFDATGVGGQQLQIDLTPTVQAWADGADNFGFALLPISGGTDGVDFWTSEAGGDITFVSFPPRLNITLGDGRTLTFQEGVNGYTGTADTTLREVNPNENFATLNTTSIDRSDGGFMTQYLLRFDDIFGTGPGQINPATDTVTSASITVNVTSEGELVFVR